MERELFRPNCDITTLWQSSTVLKTYWEAPTGPKLVFSTHKRLSKNSDSILSSSKFHLQSARWRYFILEHLIVIVPIIDAISHYFSLRFPKIS